MKNASFYKPFPVKYVLCSDIGGELAVCCWQEDNKGNRLPVFFNTREEAEQGISDHGNGIRQAVEQGDMPADRLEDIGQEVICSAALDKDLTLTIATLEGEGVYFGHISNLKD